MKNLSLNAVCGSTPVRVFESRATLVNGEWNSLPTVTLFTGAHGDSIVAVFTDRFAKRVSQGFDMSEDANRTIGNEFARFSGTDGKGHRSSIIWVALETETEADPFEEKTPAPAAPVLTIPVKAKKTNSDAGDSVRDTRLTGLREGRFTVVRPDGSRSTYRISENEDPDFFKGEGLKIAFLSGADNDADYTSAGIQLDNGRLVFWKKWTADQKAKMTRDINTIHEDPAEAGMAYAVESSHCWRCGRTLTVPTSVHNGLGPDCYEKVYGGG